MTTDQAATDQNALAEDILKNLQQSLEEGRQLEAVLERLMQALNDNGFQIAVDLVGAARNLHERLAWVSRQTGKLTDQMAQTTSLLRALTMITSTLDLDRVLDDVMDSVIELTGAERAYLMLRDRNTGELQVAVARNWDRESLSEDEAVFSRSVVRRALDEGMAIITTNAAADDRFQNVQSVVNNQLRSILCIPLIVRANAVGVLYADNRMTANVFRQDEIPLLTAFGTQAAVAIENARQYGQVKDDLNKALSELESLQIQIDQSKVQKQVSQITETDYFQRLSASAREMRQRVHRDDE
jgi:transcriptional regulator with GAF, ATPase, and Fis domain